MLVCCLVVNEVQTKDKQLHKNSGGDATYGHTRSHTEHDG